MSDVWRILGNSIVVGGTALSLLAAVGVARFPSPLARMHAATKSASLGLALIALGAGISAASPGLVGIAALVSAFLFVTAPISGHLIGRAAYLAGQAPGLVHDDLAGVHVEPEAPIRSARRDFSWPRFVVLIVVWMLLWREVSPGTLVGGGFVALAIESLRRSVDATGPLRLAPLARFVVRYLGSVIRSNLRVAWEVVTPSNEDIREAIVAVPLETGSLAARLLLANAVSYTPGTLTVELGSDPPALYVHVLHFDDAERIRTEIAAMEELVASALPSARAGRS